MILSPPNIPPSPPPIDDSFVMRVPEGEEELRGTAIRALAGLFVGPGGRTSRAEAARLARWAERALDELRRTLASESNRPGPPSSPRGLHHVGIVATGEAQIAEFARVMGLTETRREYLAAHRVTNVFLSGGPGAEVQFMLPEGGVLGNFNQGRGGLHHLAFTAPDVAGLQQELAGRGCRFITRSLAPGIGQFRFNFVLPNVAGVNVELLEDPDVEWP